jgi:hypothetical protein
MAMDYGGNSGATQDQGANAISAAQNSYKQIVDNGYTNPKIGIIPMIGVNDVIDEIFYQKDATNVLNWGKTTNYISRLSFWSIARDVKNISNNSSPSCSGIKQNDFDFMNIFKTFVG